MITALGKVQASSRDLGEDKSIIVSFGFDSRPLFLLNLSEIKSLIGAVRNDCQTMGLDVNGPTYIETPINPEVLLCVGENNRHVEAAVAMTFYGESGYGVLQHTTNIPERAVSVGAMILESPRLLESIVSVSHDKFTTFATIDPRETLDHFRQHKMDDCKSDSSISGISKYMIDWFYRKGWVLYNEPTGEVTVQGLAEEGPAEILEYGKQYWVMPSCISPTSPKCLAMERKNMQATSQQARYTQEGKIYPLKSVVLNHNRCLFIFDENRGEVDYALLEGAIGWHLSSYDRKKEPVANKKGKGPEPLST